MARDYFTHTEADAGRWERRNSPEVDRYEEADPEDRREEPYRRTPDTGRVSWASYDPWQTTEAEARALAAAENARRGYPA